MGLVAVLSVLCSTVATAQDGTLPKSVSDPLKLFLSDVVPDFTERHIENGTVEYRYKCRDYIGHSRDKLGRTFDAHTFTGPSVDGFCLRLERVDDEPVGAYGGGRIFDVKQGDYYLTYSNTYPVANNAGFIMMAYDYGVRTDPDILAGIQTLLTSGGDKLHEVIEIKEGSLTPIAAAVNDVLNSHSLNSESTATATELIWEHHARDYFGHEVDEHGEVASEVQKIHGPDSDGFIIRIWNPQRPTRPRPRGLNLESVSIARTQTRYWQRYFAVYAPANFEVERVAGTLTSKYPSFRVEILYGRKANKVILEKILDALDKIATPPSRL